MMPRSRKRALECLAAEMQPKRRELLRVSAGLAAGAVLGLRTQTSSAAAWNKAAFGATSAADAMKSMGASNPSPSKDIVFKAPDIAENGAAVSIEVASRIADTESITIIADKNPFPLVATFYFYASAEPYASTRIKMSESSTLRAIVKAGGRHYIASREVKVTIGGCG